MYCAHSKQSQKYKPLHWQHFRLVDSLGAHGKQTPEPKEYPMQQQKTSPAGNLVCTGEHIGTTLN